ncbi:MAG TPA: glycosyltransferase family 2 protein [Usitatibacter sp.]|nr:glycosyltransferase family 2 protein [Usitatibacter sp.]
MRPIICLDMIVKDEAPVIGRCLASVRPFVDRWVIVDTGSTDGTQQLVREALRDLPGTLHERPWRDFGHNRTEALQLAAREADYLLFIDADETLKAPGGFAWPELTADAYFLPVEYGDCLYGRCALVSMRLEWRWVGVLHEYLASKPEARKATLEQPRIVVSHDGARARDPQTYLKDIAILEAAVARDPQDARNVFYLAQSYRDAGRLEESAATYLRRAGMGGWDEERWFALYQVARITERLRRDPAAIVEAYLTAYECRPSRAEPLYHLARFHRERQQYARALLFAQQGLAIAMPRDMLFVERDVYRWRLLDEAGTAAYYVGAREVGRRAIERLLAPGVAPDSERARIAANLAFYAS